MDNKTEALQTGTGEAFVLLDNLEMKREKNRYLGGGGRGGACHDTGLSAMRTSGCLMGRGLQSRIAHWASSSTLYTISTSAGCDDG